jgi:pyruvate kinase
VEAIQSMQRIIDSVEGTEFVRNHEHIPIKESVTYIPDSVCFNACRMADQSGAKAIVAFAVRHLTGFRLASNRPKAPIYIFTPDHQIIHQLSIVWGVKAFYIEADRPVDDALNYSVKTLKELKYIVNGDIVVHVSSLPLYDFRGVNAIRLSYV